MSMATSYFFYGIENINYNNTEWENTRKDKNYLIPAKNERKAKRILDTRIGFIEAFAKTEKIREKRA